MDVGLGGQVSDPKSLGEAELVVGWQEGPSSVILALGERIRLVDGHCPGVPGDGDCLALAVRAGLDELFSFLEGVVTLAVDFCSGWLEGYRRPTHLFISIFKEIQGSSSRVWGGELGISYLGEGPLAAGALIDVIDICDPY